MEESSSTPGSPTAPAATVETTSTTGIHIQDALDILTARSSCHHHDKEGEQKHSGGGCGCNHSIPKGGESMGQSIDMLPQSQTEQQQTLEEKKQLLEQERLERSSKIKEELQNMTCVELIKTVLQAQEDRVVTYRQFEEGLQQSLTTGNMSLYPIACAKATASFSVLSDTINAVIQQLKSAHNNKLLSKIMVKLQKEEKEKLNLTAALHLEKIREQGTLVEGDERTAALLSEAIMALTTKITTCVQNINEFIEELRCEAMEEDD
mmetsp:Transcript_28780/g.44238  ORF Transcript_28780/g.44238 Transcript_28780/m.44238 type:complete len:264 (+) Transcript_28780:105-896(+)